MSSKKISAIVQARMGSSRLPNKSLLNLHGYPVVYWVFHRVIKSKKINDLIFCIPNSRDNDVLNNYLIQIGAKVFRGDEDDLICRYIEAARYNNTEYIVRVCADNPLICSSEIDRLIDYYFRINCNYCYNHIPRNNNYPDGLGAEIFNFELLREIDKSAVDQKHREHVTNYLWENRNKYNVKTFNAPDAIAYPDLKLDINTIEEYTKLMKIPYKINMTAEEIVKISRSPK